MNISSLVRFGLVIVLLSVVACGSGGNSTSRSTGAITAKLQWSEGRSAAGSASSGISSSAAPSGVVTVRIMVAGPDMSVVQRDFPASDGQGVVDGVPVGSSRTVTAQGLNSAGNVVYQGSKGEVSVVAEQVTDIGVITLLPLGPGGLSGDWLVLHTQQGRAEVGPDFMKISQTGSTLTFIFATTEPKTAAGNGSVSGNSVQLTIPAADNSDKCGNPAPAILTGTVSADQNTMEGTYTVPGTAQCSEAGTWRASRSQPPASDVTGSWFLRYVPQGGTEQPIGCIALAADGSFLTFTGAIQGNGMLSGSSVHLAFDVNNAADPTCPIEVRPGGTLAPGGSSMSGTYTAVPECGGSAGSGTWTGVKGSCTTPPPTAQGTLSGTVTDALSGAPLPGVSVTLSRTGSAGAIGTTGADGRYALSASAAGGYGVEFLKAGYITSTVNNVTITANTTTTLNSVLSPVLAAGQARVVLTWDYAKGQLDLDAHMKGPRAPGDIVPGPFHTWFGNQIYSFGGVKYAELDIDWISPADGPVPQETTTIYQQVAGVYTFYVHDFTNGGVPGSTFLSKSAAQVKVYLGNNLAATFDVPSGQAGTVWTVFQLNGSVLTPVNTLSADESVLQGVSLKGYLKRTSRTLR